MAGKIDFQGMMDLVEEDLQKWFAGEKVEDGVVPTGNRSKPAPEKPCILRAWYTNPGVASREELANIPFAPASQRSRSPLCEPYPICSRSLPKICTNRPL